MKHLFTSLVFVILSLSKLWAIDNNVILYTTTDGEILKPNPWVESFGANIVSNTYENGQGTILFDGSVTNIPGNAFGWMSKLSSITLPNSVTSIGEWAFAMCSFVNIDIPNGVTSIRAGAFYSCPNLTSVAFSKSITGIGEHAFSGCVGLTSINIPSGVTSIGPSAFSGCSGLTSIIVESGNKVYDSRNNCNAIIETASNTMIAGCKNTIIPNSVTCIEYSVFSGCVGLTSINIPSGVTSIGSGAFQQCIGLTSIIVESGNKVYDSRNNCNAIIETASNTMIAGCKNTIIPNSVTCIGPSVFSGCIGLTSIDIPSGVTSIGDNAFSGCSGLTGIDIPSGVTSIGSSAFYGCSGLTSINIPSGVTSIGSSAFYGCSGLTSINIPSGVTSIGSSAFYGCIGLTSITIPEGVTSIGENAFNGCIGLTSINIPSGVTSIGSSAFKGCSGLTGIDIPSGVTSIEDSAFEGCSGLTSINIPSGVTSIGSSAFKGCSGLTSIDIPSGVTYIWNSAFSGCIGLTSIELPHRLSYISDGAFAGCSSLTDLTVLASTPPSLYSTSFSDYNITLHVWYGCKKTYESAQYWEDFKNIEEIREKETDIPLNTIYYTTSDEKVIDPQLEGTFLFRDSYACKYIFGANIVSNTYENGYGILTFNQGIVQIGEYAFNNCPTLTSVIIPNGVGVVDIDAFRGCPNLKSITIPNSVTNIKGHAYPNSGLTSIIVESGNKVYDSRNNCNAVVETASNTLIFGFENTVIPNGITRIGDKAFYGCSGLTSINIPSGVTSIGDYAFSGCSGLTSVDIPSGVTSIGNNVFYDCSGLTSINIPSGVTSIGDGAFYGCSSLTSINIPNGITSIGDNAFRGCSGLTSIEIPQSVKDLGLYVFENCHRLTDVYNYASIPQKLSMDYKGMDIFYNIGTELKIHVLKGCKEIYKDPYYGWEKYYVVEDAVLPNYDTIEEGEFIIRMFEGQRSLCEYRGNNTNVILPNVDAIEREAFSNRNDIQSIVIPESVKTIGYGAFSGCKLRDIQVLATNPPSIFESTFSGQSQYHTTLFVPVGCWDAYAYDDTYWYLFINIKENASVLSELNESQAYTLKSVATRSYIVYDAVNDAVGSIELDANIDESDPNNSWQVIEQDGKTYIYNIGAKKYLTIESVNSAAPMRSAASTLRSDFKWGLSTTPVAISLSDGEGGVHIGNTGDWLFVLNEQINIDEEVVVEPEPEEEELPELLEFADKTTYNRLSKGTTYVKYSRTFNNTNWQALYVPFSIPVEVLTEKGLKIAELNDTHQWDSDGDGIADSTCIEFFTLGSGSTLANHPYLIKADEAFDLTLELSDVQLMAAKENSINCSSTKQMFTFCGTYTGVSGADMYSNNYYAMVDGSLKRVSGPDVCLMPQRWFLKIENRDGTPVKYFAPTIRISIDGIDGEPDATGLSSAICREEDNVIYSLDGVRQDAARLTKGLYIQNGQKVIVR